MKQLKRSLKALSKNLRVLTKKADMMMKMVNKLEKEAAKKPVVKKKAVKKAVRKAVRKAPVRKAVKKRKGKTATDIVLMTINRSKKGLDTAAIQKKTGYNTRKIWDIVHRANKEGKIKKIGRGIYAKA